MKTITIKGKEYIPVVERVKEFHRLYPEGSIMTQVLSEGDLVANVPNRVIVKATVVIKGHNESGKELVERTFTGFSQAEFGKGNMGGVALEVAETSAVGRALGFANIGIIDGIASADEMRKNKKTDKDKDEDEDNDLPF